MKSSPLTPNPMKKHHRTTAAKSTIASSAAHVRVGPRGGVGAIGSLRNSPAWMLAALAGLGRHRAGRGRRHVVTAINGLPDPERLQPIRRQGLRDLADEPPARRDHRVLEV